MKKSRTGNPFVNTVMSISCLFIMAAFNIEHSTAAPKVNTNNISLSGLSSGGYMATQYHLSHADKVVGVGVIGAGAYYCARGSLTTALQECVNKSPESYPDSLFSLYSEINTPENLASMADIKDTKVWLLHGALDTRIIRDVNNALVNQYKAWLPNESLKVIRDKAFAHLMPTDSHGSDCTLSESPFIGNCNFDAAGELLTFIFGDLESKVDKTELSKLGELIEFEQSSLTTIDGTGLHERGYAFLPKSCKDGEQCSIHVSFHGCNQSIDFVGNEYAKHSGLNEWAAANNMIVLYPQVQKSNMFPINPQGCWDWWGYTDENYANQDGPQIKAVNAMINNVARLLE